MIISRKFKFVYISPPKTASCSLHEAFLPFLGENDIIHNRRIRASRDYKHSRARFVKEEFAKDIWDDYFTFAFVRNPYDVCVSWYVYRKRKKLRSPRHPNHKNYSGDMSFKEWLYYVMENDQLLLRSQYNYVADVDGQVIVDFVGRYETLQEDLDTICDRVGIKRITVPRINISKERKNSIHYSEYYDEESKGIVTKIFEKDFEMFGYKYEDCLSHLSA